MPWIAFFATSTQNCPDYCKETSFSLKVAIAQALAYMAGTPNPDKSVFGFVTNGSEFRFIKLAKQETWQYAFSDLYTLQRRENELYPILKILKRLGELVKAG